MPSNFKLGIFLCQKLLDATPAYYTIEALRYQIVKFPGVKSLPSS